jgi:hypothetical protein
MQRQLGRTLAELPWRGFITRCRFSLNDFINKFDEIGRRMFDRVVNGADDEVASELRKRIGIPTCEPFNEASRRAFEGLGDNFALVFNPSKDVVSQYQSLGRDEQIGTAESAKLLLSRVRRGEGFGVTEAQEWSRNKAIVSAANELGLNLASYDEIFRADGRLDRPSKEPFVSALADAERQLLVGICGKWESGHPSTGWLILYVLHLMIAQSGGFESDFSRIPARVLAALPEAPAELSIEPHM